MQEIIQTSVMITVFVMLMMLIIEYINVQTRGQWNQPLKKKKWLQILVAALLGAIPGCLGVYTVVSLFTHKIVSFGALVASMIATSGDEAFVMFAVMPDKALWLTGIIFAIAIVAGFITNIFYKDVSFSKNKDHHFHVHEEEEKCDCFNRKIILNNFKKLNFTRALILTGLILFSVNLFLGSDHHNHSFSINNEVFSKPAYSEHKDVSKEEVLHDHSEEHNHAAEHAHPEEESIHQESIEHQHTDAEEKEEHHLNLPKIIFLILSGFAIFILITVPNHFVEEHVWNHVIKKHFLKIFLWTFGTLLLIFLAKNYLNFDIQQFAQDNIWLILLLAIVIGIIPESGPHMIFITLFISGMIPMSILLVNSIVQDGHGSLPLFAENKKAFFHMKIINMAVGAIVGVAGLLIGF